MVTDGIDRWGGAGPANPYVDTTIDAAQRAGLIVRAIYTRVLATTATAYGRGGALYLVTFLAKPEKKPGQSVKLTTEVPKAELVTASKIYVPSGQ